ncbi:MAG: class I SAM-dependent methyltransferase [Rhodospirillaceae bacterium]|nr:class I SAM-dependent methyltransferase [Rhodospirillaceae bacterium]
MSRLRQRWRRARLGVPTVLGFASHGHFAPDRHAGAALRPMHYPAVERAFRAAEPAFADHLAYLDGLRDDLVAIGSQPPPAPRWTQGWFPTLDAAAAYGMIRRHRPPLVVEVGSGHSTRFLARAIADGGVAARQVAIDPEPRAGIAGLPVEHVAAPVQQADPSVFAALGPGSMLFVDSSHIAMPGSDVDVLLNRVLPDLPAGVLVHIHDIHLPDDHPEAWHWRGYNEQCLVVPLITGGGYRVLFSSHHVATRMGDVLAASVVGSLPCEPAAPPGSLWLQKLVAP